MSNFKIEHNEGQNFLVVQSQKGQQISQREFYAIRTAQVPGLLRAELIPKGKTFKLVYNISGYISLRDYLVNPLNKQSFAKLLNNILENLKALQKAYYNYQFILMDMDAAMVNPATQQVSFVYVPITFYESGTTLKDFLLDIIQCCTFAPGEDTDYVRDYIKILNRGINFSVFDLEEYVKELKLDDQDGRRAKKCSRCGTPIQPNVNFCSSCGMRISGLKVESAQGIYDPAKAVVRPQPQPQPQPQQLQQQRQAPAQQVQRPAPVSEPAPRDPYSNTIANSVMGGQPAAQRACLTRRKNGERIPITAQTFRIGKDPFNCEYCVTDNSAISRCHAAIKYVDGKWILNDLNSTNKTYIGESVVPAYMDVELKDGMPVKFANEQFVFNLY